MQFVDQSVIRQTALTVVLDLDVERIDIEAVIRQQVFVLPRLNLVVDHVRFGPTVRIEQQIANDHLYIVRDRGLIQITQCGQEVFDNIFVFILQGEVFVTNTQVDQELLEASLVVGILNGFGQVLLIFFQEEVDPEILVEMVVQGPFVAAGNDVQDQLAGVTNLTVKIVVGLASQIISECLDLMTSATLQNGDDVDQFVAGIEVVFHPAFKLVDQLLSLHFFGILLVTIFQEENEVTQFLQREFVLDDLT